MGSAGVIVGWEIVASVRRLRPVGRERLRSPATAFCVELSLGRGKEVGVSVWVSGRRSGGVAVSLSLSSSIRWSTQSWVKAEGSALDEAWLAGDGDPSSSCNGELLPVDEGGDDRGYTIVSLEGVAGGCSLSVIEMREEV